jgi:hypothetical protein
LESVKHEQDYREHHGTRRPNSIWKRVVQATGRTKSELVEVNKDIVMMSAKTNQALWKRIRDDEGWQKIR